MERMIAGGFYGISLLAGIGWLINLVDVIAFMIRDPEWTGMQIAQVLGIFAAPLGAVMGWVTLFV